MLPVVGVGESWFSKWQDRPPTARQERRGEPDEAVKASFGDSGGTPGTYGSPRVLEDLVEADWRVSKNTRRGLDGPPGSGGPVPETEAALADPPGLGAADGRTPPC